MGRCRHATPHRCGTHPPLVVGRRILNRSTKRTRTIAASCSTRAMRSSGHSFAATSALRTRLASSTSIPAVLTGAFMYVSLDSPTYRCSQPVQIWSLDGRVVQVLDRAGTLPMSFDPSEPQSTTQRQAYRKVCVRDVSWHSQVCISERMRNAADRRPAATHNDERGLARRRLGH